MTVLSGPSKHDKNHCVFRTTTELNWHLSSVKVDPLDREVHVLLLYPPWPPKKTLVFLGLFYKKKPGPRPKPSNTMDKNGKNY